jgi:DNA polymerase III sliding clamp (beta) subunit (PCNA family)
MSQQTLLGSDLGVRVEASELAKALKFVLPFAQGQQASYHGVRLTADAGKLVLEATNGDQKATTSVVAPIAHEGTVVVPASILDGFIRSVEGAVEMKVDNDKLLVVAGASSLDLKWIEQVEWPVFEDVEADEFDLTDQWPSLKRVSWAEAGGVDKMDSHHSMHFDDDAVVVASTDCLAAIDVAGLRASANVPMPFINSLMGTIGGEVFVRFGERMVAFRSGPTTWLSRTVLDSYPAWRQLMRKEASRTLVVEKAALQAALKRTGLLPEESGFKRMTMHRVDDELVLTATGPDVGTITDVIACSGDYFDPDLIMKIDRLSALVKSSSQDELVFEMAVDAYKHIEIHEGPWSALVMPLRPPDPKAPAEYPSSGTTAPRQRPGMTDADPHRRSAS